MLSVTVNSCAAAVGPETRKGPVYNKWRCGAGSLLVHHENDGPIAPSPAGLGSLWKSTTRGMLLVDGRELRYTGCAAVYGRTHPLH